VNGNNPPFDDMKTKLKLIALCHLLSAIFFSAFAQGTEFTYQGQLQHNGSPAGGTYNLSFSLFNTNATGMPVAGPVTNNGVIISNGLFTVLIDFGPGAFTGTSNWLEIGVESNGVSSFGKALRNYRRPWRNWQEANSNNPVFSSTQNHKQETTERSQS
jgi:hypothetical protein